MDSALTDTFTFLFNSVPYTLLVRLRDGLFLFRRALCTRHERRLRRDPSPPLSEARNLGEVQEGQYNGNAVSNLEHDVFRKNASYLLKADLDVPTVGIPSDLPVLARHTETCTT